MALHSVISEIVNQIIESALGNINEEINSTSELDLKSSGKLNKSEAYECEADVKSDTIIPSTEVIVIRENDSDGGIRKEDIATEDTEFKVNDLVVKEMISGNDDDAIMLTAENILLPGNKSDGENITTESIEYKADIVVQEVARDNNSNILTDDDVLWPEKETDAEIHAKKTTIEITSSSDKMTDNEVENKIPSEEEIQLIDQFDVEDGNGEAISGDGCCDGLEVDKQGMDDGKDPIFQKTEKVTNPAFGKINTATNKHLSYPGGIKSNVITKDVRINAIETDNGDFYNNELLRKMGFTLAVFGHNRELTNLGLSSSITDLENCQVKCFNLPKGMTENHLIPLFDKVGKVFKLKIVLVNTNEYPHHAYVTYTTEEDAKKAIQVLHNSNMQGRLIQVVKYSPDERLFVTGIPWSSTKRELFDGFGYLLGGLKNIFFVESQVHAGANRGYCFLEFVDHEKAKQAIRFISRNTIFGRQLLCEWAHKPVKKTKEGTEFGTEASATLHISNLNLNIRSSDLRKWFSVYGDISDIDKDGTVATVVFRNSNDAQRASIEINKTMLGNNVKISRKLQVSTINKTGRQATPRL